MDMTCMKLLSIHVEAFLPSTSVELNVPQMIQVAAVLGIGFVFERTAHRHTAEVLLSEIGRPPGPEGENCVDRESYSLASGLALGLVTFGVSAGFTNLFFVFQIRASDRFKDCPNSSLTKCVFTSSSQKLTFCVWFGFSSVEEK